jgi:hypothetical protein
MTNSLVFLVPILDNTGKATTCHTERRKTRREREKEGNHYQSVCRKGNGRGGGALEPVSIISMETKVVREPVHGEKSQDLNRKMFVIDRKTTLLIMPS